MADHEGFGHENILDLAQLCGFFGRDGNRLLAQHVLAGLRCSERERHMEMIGQRIVDGLDLGVGQHLFIGAIGLGNTQFSGPFLGGLLAAR